MSKPDHISDEAYEWAEIFMDAHRGVEDDRELLALAYQELRGRPDMVGLTRLQAGVLDFVQGFVATHGYSPSFRDIARGCGLSSASGAHRVVHALCDKGLLNMMPGQTRGIALAGRA